MSDLISRQDAIDLLEKQLDYLQTLNKDENPTAESKWYGVNWARNTIADLPSAEPKKGKWIRITQGATPEKYMCPFCHRTVETYGIKELLPTYYPYCHCGADMRGEE